MSLQPSAEGTTGGIAPESEHASSSRHRLAPAFVSTISSRNSGVNCCQCLTAATLTASLFSHHTTPTNGEAAGSSPSITPNDSGPLLRPQKNNLRPTLGLWESLCVPFTSPPLLRHTSFLVDTVPQPRTRSPNHTHGSLLPTPVVHATADPGGDSAIPSDFPMDALPPSLRVANPGRWEDYLLAQELLRWLKRFDAITALLAGLQTKGKLLTVRIQSLATAALGSSNPNHLKKADSLISEEDDREYRLLWELLVRQRLLPRAIHLMRRTQQAQFALITIRFFISVTAGYQLLPQLASRTSATMEVLEPLTVYVHVCQRFGLPRQLPLDYHHPQYLTHMYNNSSCQSSASAWRRSSIPSSTDENSSSSTVSCSGTALHQQIPVSPTPLTRPIPPLVWICEVLQLAKQWIQSLPQARPEVLQMLVTTLPSPSPTTNPTWDVVATAVDPAPSLLALILSHFLTTAATGDPMTSPRALPVAATLSATPMHTTAREHRHEVKVLTILLQLCAVLLGGEGSDPTPTPRAPLGSSSRTVSSNGVDGTSHNAPPLLTRLQLRLCRTLIYGSISGRSHRRGLFPSILRAVAHAVQELIHRSLDNPFSSRILQLQQFRRDVSTSQPTLLASTLNSIHSVAGSVLTTSSVLSSSICEWKEAPAAVPYSLLIESGLATLTAMMALLGDPTTATATPNPEAAATSTADHSCIMRDWHSCVQAIVESNLLEGLVGLLRHPRSAALPPEMRASIVQYVCTLLVQAPGPRDSLVSAASMSLLESLWHTTGLWAFLRELLEAGNVAARQVLLQSIPETSSRRGRQDCKCGDAVEGQTHPSVKTQQWLPLPVRMTSLSQAFTDGSSVTHVIGSDSSDLGIGDRRVSIPGDTSSASSNDSNEVGGDYSSLYGTGEKVLCPPSLTDSIPTSSLTANRHALSCMAYAVAVVQHAAVQLTSISAAPAAASGENGRPKNGVATFDTDAQSAGLSQQADLPHRKWMVRQLIRNRVLDELVQFLATAATPPTSVAGEAYHRARSDMEHPLELQLVSGGTKKPSSGAALASSTGITSNTSFAALFDASSTSRGAGGRIPTRRIGSNALTAEDGDTLHQLLAVECASVRVLEIMLMNVPATCKTFLAHRSDTDTVSALIRYVERLSGGYLTETLRDQCVDALCDALRALSFLCREGDSTDSPIDQTIPQKDAVQLVIDGGLVPVLAKLMSRPVWCCRYVPLAALGLVDVLLTYRRLSSPCRLRLLMQSRLLLPSLLSIIIGKDWKVLLDVPALQGTSDSICALNGGEALNPGVFAETDSVNQGMRNTYVNLQRTLQVGALRTLRRWLTAPVTIKCGAEDGILDLRVTTPIRTGWSLINRCDDPPISAFANHGPAGPHSQPPAGLYPESLTPTCAASAEEWDFLLPLLGLEDLLEFIRSTLKADGLDDLFEAPLPPAAVFPHPPSCTTTPTIGATVPPTSWRYHDEASVADGPPWIPLSSPVTPGLTYPTAPVAACTHKASKDATTEERESRSYQRRLLREVLQLLNAMGTSPCDGTERTMGRRCREHSWRTLFDKLTKLFDALLARRVTQQSPYVSTDDEADPAGVSRLVVSIDLPNSCRVADVSREEDDIFRMTLQAVMNFFPPFYIPSDDRPFPLATGPSTRSHTPSYAPNSRGSALASDISAVNHHLDSHSLPTQDRSSASRARYPLETMIVSLTTTSDAASSNADGNQYGQVIPLHVTTEAPSQLMRCRYWEDVNTYLLQLQEAASKAIRLSLMDALVSAWTSSPPGMRRLGVSHSPNYLDCELTKREVSVVNGEGYNCLGSVVGSSVSNAIRASMMNLDGSSSNHATDNNVANYMSPQRSDALALLQMLVRVVKAGSGSAVYRTGMGGIP